MRVHDPVVGGQSAVAGDVVPEVVVGHRHDAAGVDVHSRSKAWSVKVPLGVWLTLAGVDQVSPPSSEWDSRIGSSPNELLSWSCQVM
jgi:hypothetical protein